jgi:hypothetical protein
MIIDKENQVEEEESLKSSSAPTVLDLRAALKDLLADLDAELDLTSPDDALPHQPD